MPSLDEDRTNREERMNDRISLREWGGVLERLRQQDQVLAAQNIKMETMSKDIAELLALANRGKGSLMMLMSIGSVVGVIVGWVIEHLLIK